MSERECLGYWKPPQEQVADVVVEPDVDTL